MGYEVSLLQGPVSIKNRSPRFRKLFDRTVSCTTRGQFKCVCIPSTEKSFRWELLLIFFQLLTVFCRCLWSSWRRVDVLSIPWESVKCNSSQDSSSSSKIGYNLESKFTKHGLNQLNELKCSRCADRQHQEIELLTVSVSICECGMWSICFVIGCYFIVCFRIKNSAFTMIWSIFSVILMNNCCT